MNARTLPLHRLDGDGPPQRDRLDGDGPPQREEIPTRLIPRGSGELPPPADS
ncbi:hypothetical protein [Streptomyces rimosus]|uniref:hypothetical protein n=1 Tax=Streptomyces rimosus TaxID=1927 RepID=UPI000AA98E81|nr:hypothetical protein [Streptomyces rimosus]